MHADGNAMHRVSNGNIHEYFYFYIYKTCLKYFRPISLPDEKQLKYEKSAISFSVGGRCIYSRLF